MLQEGDVRYHTCITCRKGVIVSEVVNRNGKRCAQPIKKSTNWGGAREKSMSIEMKDHVMHSSVSTTRSEIIAKSVLVKEECQAKLELTKVESKSGISHDVRKCEAVENVEAI